MLGRAQLKLGQDPAGDRLAAQGLRPQSGRRAASSSPSPRPTSRPTSRGDAAQLLGRVNPAVARRRSSRAPTRSSTRWRSTRAARGTRAAAELAKAAAASPNDAALQYQYGAAALNAGNIPAAVGRAREGDAARPQGPEQGQGLRAGADPLGARDERRGQGRRPTPRPPRRPAAWWPPTPATTTCCCSARPSSAPASTTRRSRASAQATGKNAADWLPLFYTGQAYTAKGDLPAGGRRAPEGAPARPPRATTGAASTSSSASSTRSRRTSTGEDRLPERRRRRRGRPHHREPEDRRAQPGRGCRREEGGRAQEGAGRGPQGPRAGRRPAAALSPTRARAARPSQVVSGEPQWAPRSFGK